MEQDPERAAGRVTRAFGGIVALTYVAGLGGKMYSFGEIGRWLDEVGFRQQRRIAMRRILSGLLIAKNS